MFTFPKFVLFMFVLIMVTNSPAACFARMAFSAPLMWSGVIDTESAFYIAFDLYILELPEPFGLIDMKL